MKKKTLMTALSPETVKYVQATFSSQYQGLQIATESFFILRRHAQGELRGIFSANELKAIADIMNATLFEPKMAQKSLLKARLEDSELYDKTLTKWGVSLPEIVTKVDGLTEIHAFFLIFEAWNFWYNPQSGDNPDIESFVSMLI